MKMITILSSMPYGNSIELSSADKAVDDNKILKRTGRNTGNLMFHHAAPLLTKEHLIFIDLGTDTDIVKELTSLSKLLVIPLANILNEQLPVNGHLTRIIKASQCPVMVLGLGAQSKQSANAESFTLPEKSQEFLKVLSKKAIMVSCRGQFTLDICKSYLKSLPNSFYKFGCPSILISPNNQLGKVIYEKFKIQQAALLKSNKLPNNIIYTVGNIIKFIKDPYSDDPSQKRLALENSLMKLLVQEKRYKSRIVFQTEPFLFNLVSKRNQSDSLETIKILSRYFPFAKDCLESKIFSAIEIKKIANMFYYYHNASGWILDAERASMSLSSRLHGTIAPLMAEIPSVCYYHDSRTKELCEALKLPCVNLSLMNNFSEEAIIKSFCDAFAAFNPENFDAHRIDYANTINSKFIELDISPSGHLESIISSTKQAN